jgi:putative oxidoreductase
VRQNALTETKEAKMGLWRLILRLTMGFLFVGHGTQKLFGWFEGEGVEKTGETMDELGLHPGRPHAVMAGLTEASSGALLLAGAEVPAAAGGITAVMLTAIKRVHLRNGPWVTKGGYEYPLVAIASALALVESGPGMLSVDRLRGRERYGAGWAAMAFGAGSLAAWAIDQLAARDLRSSVEWLDEHRPHPHRMIERLAA